MPSTNDLWNEIPSYAYVSLARRGMEKISLDQCFLENCDNKDIKLLEPFKLEEFEDDKKKSKLIHIKCNKCNRKFAIKLETIKKVSKAKSEKEGSELSMGLIYALDEDGKNIGHIGYY